MTAARVVIVGAGPAGAAAACVLAGAGRDVVVLERETTTGHKLCGEFLGGPTLTRLAALGIDAAALGAHPIRQVRVVRDDRTALRTLPFPAAGLSRRCLDAGLRARAAALGAEIRYGVRASEIASGAVVADGASVPAGTVMLGTGKHDIRGVPRRVGRVPDGMLGFKMHFRLRPAAQAALTGAVELFLFRDSYVGLQLIEGGTANLCLLADRSRLGSDWQDLVAGFTAESTVLRDRLARALPVFDRPLTIARVPYGFLYSDARNDGVYRLGDQMGVIPSFAGEGLAIALHTGMAAAHCVLAGRDASAYHAAMRNALARPLGVATAIHRAGRSPIGQRAVFAAARMPFALGLMARATRVGVVE
ncbi:MAG TPA: FAD-dependent monooxygenase [Acetobacteraceae bacterium]|jgi:flavin-dependent dehydrogenase|nr:FAD-dependent monooxygenase [Acetobacteraceae bacterium]